MLKVLPARAEMLEDICRLHHGPHTDARDRERIRAGHAAIFSTAWHRGDRPPGHVLAGPDGIKGFIGAFHANRLIGGVRRLVCNLSYWMVAEGHRSQGLRLMMPYLTDPALILTGFTASPAAYGIYQRLGFQPLDHGVRIVPNLPLPHRWRLRARTYTDPYEIQPRLDPVTAELCADHTGLPCWHLLVTHGDRRCYVLYSLTHKRRRAMAYVHHVSDPEAFGFLFEHVKAALLLRHRFLFLAIEERLLGGAIPKLSLRFPLPIPRIFRGEDVTPAAIDSAYTELIPVGSFRAYFY